MKLPISTLMNPKEMVGFMGFSYWRNSAKKRNSKIQKRSDDFGGFQSPKVRKFRKKERNNCQIHILFSFHCVAKGWFKICTLFLVYSQIWINLPRDDHHFGYKQEFLLPKKNTAKSPRGRSRANSESTTAKKFPLTRHRASRENI
jgi:hypothetical protein